MELVAIVDEKWGLGRGDDLLFTLPPDMRRFRALTLGHVVVLGRRTLETFPCGYPLPNREHLVLTRDIRSLYGRPVQAFTDLPSLLQTLATPEYKDKTIRVIGGADVYRQLLPYCTEAYITHVYADGNATCFLPDLSQEPGWALAEISELMRYDLLDYAFAIYENHAPLSF